MMTVDKNLLSKLLVLFLLLQSCIPRSYGYDYDGIIEDDEESYQGAVYKNANYTNNKYNPLNKEEDIWRQRQADQTQLRFIQSGKDSVIRTHENCKDFELVNCVYIKCIGVYELIEMISIKDKNLWTQTISRSYYFPETLAISKDKYVVESERLELLKKNKIITSQEYDTSLEILNSIKMYENDNDSLHLPLRKGSFTSFKEPIMAEANHLYRYYYQLSRVQQLRHCIRILTTSLELNNFISKIPSQDIIDRLIIKFTKLVDAMLIGSSYIDYSDINAAIKSSIQKIDESQKNLMPGNDLLTPDFGYLKMRLLLNKIFYIKLEDFFMSIPQDLEFYQFSDYKPVDSLNKDIIKYQSMKTLFGLAPNYHDYYTFNIKISYYNMYNDKTYTLYAELRLDIDDQLVENEESWTEYDYSGYNQYYDSWYRSETEYEDQPSSSSNIFYEAFLFILKLFLTILFLSFLLLTVWVLFKIYKARDCSSAPKIILEALSFALLVLKKCLCCGYTTLVHTFTFLKNLRCRQRKYKISIGPTLLDDENLRSKGYDYGERNSTYTKISNF